MNNRGLIGVQMMMLGGKVRELGAFEVLRRLAKMGFHCIEISQIPMTAENVAEIRRACTRLTFALPHAPPHWIRLPWEENPSPPILIKSFPIAKR